MGVLHINLGVEAVCRDGRLLFQYLLRFLLLLLRLLIVSRVIAVFVILSGSAVLCCDGVFLVLSPSGLQISRCPYCVHQLGEVLVLHPLHVGNGASAVFGKADQMLGRRGHLFLEASTVSVLSVRSDQLSKLLKLRELVRGEGGRSSLT